MQWTGIVSAFFALSAATAAAYGQDQADTNDYEVRKVDRVYVREAAGLFFERKLMRRAEGRQVWVDARGRGQVGAAATGELFKIPEGIDVSRGDLVATRMGDGGGPGFHLLPKPNQVTQLVAPSDSLMALTFGAPSHSTGIWLNASAR